MQVYSVSGLKIAFKKGQAMRHDATHSTPTKSGVTHYEFRETSADLADLCIVENKYIIQIFNLGKNNENNAWNRQKVARVELDKE